MTIPVGPYCYENREISGPLIQATPEDQLLADIFHGTAEPRKPVEKIMCPYWSLENINGDMVAFCSKHNQADVPGKSLLFDMIKLSDCV